MKRKEWLAAVAVWIGCLAGQTAAAQSEKLFNGKNLDNWNLFVEKSDADPKDVFKVQDGVIRIEGLPMGYMYTREQYDNFKLHVEWRWVGKPSNSGVFLFVQDGEKTWPNAIECQLCAGDAGDFVLLGGSDIAEFRLQPGETRPAFPVVKKKRESSEKNAGEWNEMEITCRDGNIEVVVNGVLQNQGSQSLHKKGYIGLQSEGGPLEFRNVRLKRLK